MSCVTFTLLFAYLDKKQVSLSKKKWKTLSPYSIRRAIYVNKTNFNHAANLHCMRNVYLLNPPPPNKKKKKKENWINEK